MIMEALARYFFETHVYPSFPGVAHGLRRKDNGEYVSGSLEDHWQTFQEGFEFAYLEAIAVLLDVYRKTPLELCGPLLEADQAIVAHFYNASKSYNEIQNT